MSGRTGALPTTVFDGRTGIVVRGDPNSDAFQRRFAEQAYRAWFICGAEPLSILITATDRISHHREGILGPIWRTPGPPNPLGNPVRQYWLPGGPPPGLFGTGRQPVRTPRLVWPTASQLRRRQPRGDM